MPGKSIFPDLNKKVGEFNRLGVGVLNDEMF